MISPVNTPFEAGGIPFLDETRKEKDYRQAGNVQCRIFPLHFFGVTENQKHSIL
jgi:hypothetical protein